MFKHFSNSYRIDGTKMVCPMLFLRRSVLADLPGFSDSPTPFPGPAALGGGKLIPFLAVK